MDRIPVGIVGCGYWGPNLIRNFSSCRETEVAGICDANPARLEAIGRMNGQAKCVSSLDELLDLPIKAVAIATPVSTHFAIAKRCLERGMHVLVEKPLTATVQEAKELVELAERMGRVLMVDHTYLFSKPIGLIKNLIEQGELGELYYIDSVRINLGLFQRDINVIWDLAPHDLSIISYLLEPDARSISAWGCAHANPDIEDIAYVNVDYGERLMASLHVNWLSPVKVRQMMFAGSKKSLIFNELNTSEPIKVYDRGIEMGQNEEERHRLLISYRSGDVWSPHVEPGEALQGVVGHFAECIREQKRPVSDGWLGLRVVRLLEAATRSLRAQGGRVVLSNGAKGNGFNDTRAGGVGQLSTDCPGREARQEREHSLLR
ncbi:MAG TPA: Gfo/Idh/MocA family oxidoreductase [Tepidisphaeraceae bacterium]|nr:Gfo/Idh/MocA family oxidoreductase [Tepidisphaeraceae bacterium]